MERGERWDGPEEYAETLRQVRQAMEDLDLDRAEALLESMDRREGEWYFLRGGVYFRRGWMDEARRHYETAVRLDPENARYRRALDQMGGGSRNGGEPAGTLCAKGACVGLGAVYAVCQAGSCCLCCGGGLTCCFCIQEMPR